MKPEAGDRRAPLKGTSTKEVGLAMVTMGQMDSLHYGQCSCGVALYHKRLKVLEDKIDKHLDRKHQGRGIRL